MQMKFLLLLAVCSGWVALVQATSCSNSYNYCTTSLNVTSSCTDDKCVCTDTTNTQVDWGCADPTGLTAPTVDAGQFSGEVLADKLIKLFCRHADIYGTNAVTYAWYEGESTTPIPSEADDEYERTVASDDNVAISCEITVKGVSRKSSNSITVKAFAATGDITTKPTVYYEEGVTSYFEGAKLTLKCGNLPKDVDSHIPAYTWSNVASLGDQKVDDTVSGVTCKANFDDGTFSSDSDPSVLPVEKAHTEATSEISPSQDFTIQIGATQALTCDMTAQISDTDMTAITYKWQDGTGGDVTPGGGADTKTLVIDSSTIATLSFKCQVWYDSGSGAAAAGTLSSARQVEVVAADQIQAIEAVPYPTAPLVGGPLRIRCLIAASASAYGSITYSWQYNSETMPGQSDNMLQVGTVVDNTHAGGNAYTCTATKDDYIQLSDDTPTVTAKALTAINTAGATITPLDKVGSDYLNGNSYTLECGWEGFTYKWFKGVEEIDGEIDASITIIATDTPVDYTCKGVWGTTVTDASTALTVDGIDYASITGSASPVEGTSPVYVCNYFLSSGTPTVAMVYGSTTSSSTKLTIPSVSGGPTDVTCTVSGGSSDLTDTKSVTAAATPTQPSIDTGTAVNNRINTGGSYTLTCKTASISSADSVSATYAWERDGNPLDSTSSTYKISSASSGDAGSYKCTVTIDGKTSLASSAEALTLGDKNGKYCEATAGTYFYTTQCGSDFDKYTGNCIDNRCECADGVTLSQDDCGTTSGGLMTVASLLTIFLGMLLTQIMG